MNLLNELINTVGLDKSFFYQLCLAVALYFLLKKLLFQPYLEKLSQRESLTQGRLKNSEELGLKIEEKKKAYEEKAQKLHIEFQKIFNKSKKQAQDNFLKESLKLKEEQKDWIKKERSNLKLALKEQEQILEKELKELTKLLVKKIAG